MNPETTLQEIRNHRIDKVLATYNASIDDGEIMTSKDLIRWLLTDLRHYCFARKIDFECVNANAKITFRNEKADGE